MTKVTKKLKCHLKGEHPVAKSLVQLARGLWNFNKRKSGSHPRLLTMHPSGFVDGVWTLDIDSVTEEIFKNRDSFNRRLNNVGRKIFGTESFKCSHEFADDLDATGQIAMNWNAVTRCKINLPKGDQQLLDHLSYINFDWKKGSIGVPPDVVSPTLHISVDQWFGWNYARDWEPWVWDNCDFDVEIQ